MSFHNLQNRIDDPPSFSVPEAIQQILRNSVNGGVTDSEMVALGSWIVRPEIEYSGSFLVTTQFRLGRDNLGLFRVQIAETPSLPHWNCGDGESWFTPALPTSTIFGDIILRKQISYKDGTILTRIIYQVLRKDNLFGYYRTVIEFVLFFNRHISETSSSSSEDF